MIRHMLNHNGAWEDCRCVCLFRSGAVPVSCLSFAGTVPVVLSMEASCC